MTIKEIFRLSHRELVAYRTRSRATVITIGVLFGFLLAILFIMQGLENVVLRYAGNKTDNVVYLASSYENRNLVLERISEFDGEITTLTNEQKAEIGEEIPDSFVLAKFDNLENAYRYYSKTDAKELHYNADDYEIVELFSNQVRAYRYFREKNRSFVRPASIVLMIVSAFILAFTMAHLIASSTKTFVLYRSIGASKSQLLIIYFVYLMELCVFLAAPVSFLLCLDQFSNKKIAQKLKGD